MEDDCLEIGFNALEQSIGSPGSSILNDEDNRANEAPKLTSTPNKTETDKDATPTAYYNPASDFLYRRSRGETQSQGIPSAPILPTITPRDEFGGRARGRKTHRDTEASQLKVASSAQQTGSNMYVENGSLHISVQQGSAMSARMHEGVSDTSSEAATTASLPGPRR